MFLYFDNHQKSIFYFRWSCQSTYAIVWFMEKEILYVIEWPCFWSYINVIFCRIYTWRDQPLGVFQNQPPGEKVISSLYFYLSNPASCYHQAAAWLVYYLLQFCFLEVYKIHLKWLSINRVQSPSRIRLMLHTEHGINCQTVSLALSYIPSIWPSGVILNICVSIEYTSSLVVAIVYHNSYYQRSESVWLEMCPLHLMIKVSQKARWNWHLR